MATASTPASNARKHQMPQLLCVSNGRGKNARVTLENLADVAAALERPAGHIAAYMQYALSVKPSTGAGGAISLRATPAQIDPLLRQYVEEWVLCGAAACRLPECQLLVDREGARPEVRLLCSACGHCAAPPAGVLAKQAKFVKHILAHPPAAKGGPQAIGQGIRDVEDDIGEAERAKAARKVSWKTNNHAKAVGPGLEPEELEAEAGAADMTGVPPRIAIDCGNVISVTDTDTDTDTGGGANGGCGVAVCGAFHGES